MRYALVHIILLFVVLQLTAQEKYEHEYRIKALEVPEVAVNFINKIPNTKRLKWYAEESQQGKSIEAKFYGSHHKVSVEFSENGSIQDIEFKVLLNEIPKDQQDAIRQALSNKFVRFTPYLGYQLNNKDRIEFGLDYRTVKFNDSNLWSRTTWYISI